MDHPLAIVAFIWMGSLTSYLLFMRNHAAAVSKWGPGSELLFCFCCFAFAAVYYVLSIPFLAVGGWLVTKIHKSLRGKLRKGGG